MKSPVRIVFYGEILPGHRPERVKSDISALLKLKGEEIDSVFSGKRVVLRKDLPADQAPRYEAHLEKLGVRVVVEPMATDADTSGFPPLAAVDDLTKTSSTSPELSGQPSVPVVAPLAPDSDSNVPPPPEEMECPKCHERQPKRTLCRSCAVDMPRFLAAQQAAQEEERAASLAARQASTGTRRPVSRDIDDSEHARAETSWMGFDFSGRIGRMSYLVGTLVSSIVASWLFVAAMKMQGFVLVLLTVAVLAFYGVRLAVLRLHDIGVTGWWWLASFVPIANFALTVVLFFVPGSREDKGYGSPSRGSGLMSVAVTALLFIITATVLMEQARTSLPELVAAYGGKSHGLQRGDRNADGTSASGVTDFHPSSNTVVMYSLSTCPYCAQKRQELDASGIVYTELFIDEDEQAATSLQEKLQHAGLPARTYGVPILDVNGTMLPNNPSMDEITRYLD